MQGDLTVRNIYRSGVFVNWTPFNLYRSQADFRDLAGQPGHPFVRVDDPTEMVPLPGGMGFCRSNRVHAPHELIQRSMERKTG